MKCSQAPRAPQRGSPAAPLATLPPGHCCRPAQLALVSPRPCRPRARALEAPSRGLSLPTFLCLPRDSESLQPSPGGQWRPGQESGQAEWE